MKITAEKRDTGKFVFYTVNIASGEGKEPFLSIKDCKLIEGAKGPFVGFPSRKDAQEKWWPMVWANDSFQAAVIDAMRKAEVKTHGEMKQQAPLDDIPFN